MTRDPQPVGTLTPEYRGGLGPLVAPLPEEATLEIGNVRVTLVLES